MKKKVVCILMVTLLMIALAACGSKNDQNSSDDSLGEDSGNETTIPDDILDDEETFDPASISIYYLSPNEEAIETLTETLNNGEVTVEEVISTLKKFDVISEDTDSNSLVEDTEEDTNTILKLDLNESFKEYLNTLDADKEALIMQCIANTFLDAFEADQLFITIDGEPLATEHNSYEEALTFTEADNNTEKDDSQEEEEPDTTSDDSQDQE